MDKDRAESLTAFEHIFGYTFKNRDLLDTALIHRSFINENQADPREDNERMEFLGDAVLELCVSDLLMKRYEDHDEGQLSRMRASIVNELSLARLAANFRVGDFLLLGKGEESSGGRMKTSILSNTFEALVAAVYLDCGFDHAASFLATVFQPLVEASENDPTFRDYKTSLQGLCQSRFKTVPRYHLMNESGPDHDKLFQVRVSVSDILAEWGIGKSKKEAEQQAARKALETLGELSWEEP
jgi:ribonuclease-3